MDGNEPVSGCAVPLIIQAPVSSELVENHQLDSMHPADAGIEESLAADPSVSPRAATADQHGSDPCSAPLALENRGIIAGPFMAYIDTKLTPTPSAIQPSSTSGSTAL
ncbi:hypothetical protein Nepgr_004012 [Nepenthes gracilis]|uniref:Uncharacterized protein n=1 Tax=Nepenthes gracilis TaxID=150966 RepID=A0AAD3XEJ3_NEPGR|nr:hypothetical protein Nepgr_004012 [Nepenthes gracilis]